ncbi:MAG: MoaD/ThiS family protein [Saprospiraceae bacterium]
MQQSTNFNTTLLAFGIMRDIVGGSTLEFSITAGSTVADLQTALEAQFPKIKALRSFLIAVNNEYGDAELVIQKGDEIALIPPVSGG